MLRMKPFFKKDARSKEGILPPPPAPSLEFNSDYKAHEKAMEFHAAPPPRPSMEASADFVEHDQIVDDKKRYEVELIALPGESKEKEILESLKAALQLVMLKQHNQAAMLYQIIDTEFKKHFEDFKKNEDIKLLYDELAFYVWVDDAYKLSKLRRLAELKKKMPIIKLLLAQVVKAGPLNTGPFMSAKSKLTFINSVLDSRVNSSRGDGL